MTTISRNCSLSSETLPKDAVSGFSTSSLLVHTSTPRSASFQMGRLTSATVNLTSKLSTMAGIGVCIATRNLSMNLHYDPVLVRMAKVNKLALARMALRLTLNELDNRELLCVLTDMYTPPPEATSCRWYGNGGGTSGLEQGIYNHMTTFRRVANLWTKIQSLSPDIKLDTQKARDIVVKRLTDKGVDLTEIGGEAPPNE
jgi:hypothetical protein